MLDLDPSELLQMVNVFVMVEGEHDVALLGEVFRDELQNAGAELVPMRGSDTLDSPVGKQSPFPLHDRWCCCGP